LKAGLGVAVIVAVGVALRVGVAEMVGVAEIVGVAVTVGVVVAVKVAVAVAVAVGVATAARPTPSSFTFCGLWAARSVKVSDPWNLPFDGGVNDTPTVQFSPLDKMPMHTNGLKLNPLPLTATFGAAIGASLVNATPC
jgi:hypothetical protein